MRALAARMPDNRAVPNHLETTPLLFARNMTRRAPRLNECHNASTSRPTPLLRYTRLLLTEALRQQMHDLLGCGLGIQLLALGEKPEG